MAGPAGRGGCGWRRSLPLALLLAGLLLIQRSYVDQQIRAAAEIDAALLADDLPPAGLQRPGLRRVPEVAAPVE